MQITFQTSCSYDTNMRIAVTKIEKILSDVRKSCDDEIEKSYETLKTEICNNGIGYDISSDPYEERSKTPHIYYENTIEKFIEEGAPDLVNIVRRVYTREVALYRFMTEGFIMPISGCNKKTSFLTTINFLKNNIAICVDIDMMPFEKYVVIKVPQ